MTTTNASKIANIEWGVVLKALAGHAECGDQYVVQPATNGALVAAIDGLGHGDKAADAAKLAQAVIAEYGHEPLISLVNRCHKRLIGTRGVVMSLATVNTAERTLTWLGIGNVHGALFHAGNGSGIAKAYEALVLRGGTLGYRLPTLRPETHSLTSGDTLILVSDGVRSGFSSELDLRLSPQALADFIFQNYARGTDDTLVLVVRYMEAPE